jgi:hypothetical protein
MLRTVHGTWPTSGLTLQGYAAPEGSTDQPDAVDRNRFDFRPPGYSAFRLSLFFPCYFPDISGRDRLNQLP